MYDFNARIDRSGVHSLKWDNPHNTPGQENILPLWVADMDFEALPEIQQALLDRLRKPIFGYMRFPPAYFDSILDWHKTRYHRSLTREMLIPIPSVLHGLSMALRAFSNPGDAVLVQPPVYTPFFRVVTLNQRVVVEAPLKEPENPGQAWRFDPEQTRARLRASHEAGAPVKLWLFCSPQNPTGRVWTKKELESVAQIAQEFDLLVLSDEIHADLVNPLVNFTSALDLPSLAERSLVVTGPNKTFNMAGLAIAHAFTRNPELALKFRRAVEADFYNEPHVLSIEAAWAAYRHGHQWLNELLEHLKGNFDVLRERLAAWNPPLTVCPWEGTYLAWVDARPLLAQRAYRDVAHLTESWEVSGRVKITAGSIYCTGGEGWLRFNLACPRPLLEQALDRIERWEKLTT
ncbi:MAG: putative C-S lyase [Spirochaetales bacterium]|nr:putative C-S lyase [Spirochaetales bacterium]